MKSSGQTKVPGPSSGCRPPTEPSASTRSQPASSQGSHVGQVVDPVREDVAVGAVALQVDGIR